MKMHSLDTTVFLKAALAAAGLLLSLAGCGSIIEEEADRSGSVRVSIANAEELVSGQAAQTASAQGPSYTKIPEGAFALFDYEYWFKPTGREPAAPTEPSSGDDMFTLPTGEYTVRVKVFIKGSGGYTAAYNDIDSYNEVASGDSEPFTVEAQLLRTGVNVTLYPYTGGTGVGAFSYSIKRPAASIITELSLTPFDGRAAYDYTNSEQDVTAGGVLVRSATKPGLPEGYYTFFVQLEDADGKTAGDAEVVHIYAGMATEIVLEFVEADFVDSAKSGVGAFDLSTKTGTGDGWQYLSPVLTILRNSEVTVTGTSTESRILVMGASTVILDNVSIFLSGTAAASALDWASSVNIVDAGRTITLRLKGTNTLVASGNAAGIHVPKGYALTVTSAEEDGSTEGDLIVTGGGTGGAGAGIGGNFGEEAGSITLTGGIVVATGGAKGSAWGGAAGVGGGGDLNSQSAGSGRGQAGTILISGGEVNATGGDGAAGIGGGAFAGGSGSVTIAGGVVKATGGENGAGIGGGSGGAGGAILISGGQITATGPGNGAGIGGGSGGAGGNVRIIGGRGMAQSGAVIAVGPGAGGAGGSFNENTGNWPAANPYIWGTWIVTFDGNGGVAWGSGSKTVLFGQPYGTLPTAEMWSAEGPVRYAFAGWWTQKTGGEQITEATLVTTAAEHTLYAHWMEYPAGHFIVTFEGAGGVVVGSTTMDVELGNFYGTLPLAEREGTPGKRYIFAGWWTQEIGGEQVTEATLVNVAAEHTLYAHWIEYPVDQFVVSFDGSGGVVLGAASKDVTLGQLYGILPQAEREDSAESRYVFAGWWTQAAGGTQITETTLVETSADHTLYAHWTEYPVEHFIVTFEGTGGVVLGSTVTNVVFGQPYGPLPQAERAGYTFAGWWTEESGGEQVTESAIVGIAADHSLYAHWAEEQAE